MIKNIILTGFLLIAGLKSYAQQQSFAVEELQVNELLKGDLYSPAKSQPQKTTLIILIAGSGPTNRNGNQLKGRNNSLKYLAEDLCKDNYAVFTYDKRVIAQIIAGTVNEKEMRFDDMITDAVTVFDYLKNKYHYSKILFAGHSEGSLIGMIAAQKTKADAFISLAGPGRPIDEILVEQITRQTPALKEELVQSFAALKKGETIEIKKPLLASILRESVQPYMKSWMQYNPQTEISKLKVPVLIINGDKDLQVRVLDAELLQKSKPGATLNIIPNMNHVFKNITGDEAENLASYSDPDTRNTPELSEKINLFLKKNKL